MSDSRAAPPVKSRRRAACPICKKASVQDFRPFCSKKCADIDLGNWLSDHYALPVEGDWDEDGSRPTPRQGEKDEG